MMQLFWVRNPPEKTQDGKTGTAVKYIFYYDKIWNVTITTNSPKPGEYITRKNHWEKPQLNLSTLLRECTAQLYEAQ